MLGEHDFYVARSLLDPVRAALRAGPDAPHARALIHGDRADDEVVDVDPRLLPIVLVLGVRERRRVLHAVDDRDARLRRPRGDGIGARGGRRRCRRHQRTGISEKC